MNCFRDQILTFDARVPRYTSYPTAPQFSPIADEKEYAQSLVRINAQNNISLYIHVPFCSKLCWYCGCNTKITRRYAPVEDYAHLLLREIDLVAEKLHQDHKICSIHFGGGSPGLLRACDFEMIISKLRSRMNISNASEIAIELDPRGITEGRIATYAKCGVNRVSLGVQDFDEKVLTAVNRQQPFALSYEAVKLLRKYGIEHINVDVMYGLPHQTLETQSRTFEKLLLLKPGRIAFFGYAHVPWMKKHMRLIDETSLPQKDLRFDLFEAGQNFLEENGYVPIGIDHFARPDDALVKAKHDGRLTRNFQGYVDDPSDTFIGLGVSSIGKTKTHYFQNFSDMPSYKNAILGGHLAVAKHCEISKDDEIRAKIIEQLMCYFKVNLHDICALFGCPVSMFETELNQLKSYEKLGFITIDNASVQIDPKAKLMARTICSIFDAHIQKSAGLKTPKHAQAI